jgi:hypothetical protein
MFDIEITSTHLMVGIKGNSERFLNVASHSLAGDTETHRLPRTAEAGCVQLQESRASVLS